MLWKHDPQALVSTAISSLPKYSPLFYDLLFLINYFISSIVSSDLVLGEGEGEGEEDKGKIDTNAEQDSDQLVTKETLDDKSPNR